MLVCYTYVCSIAPVQRPNGQRLDENVPFSILPFVILAIPLLEIAVFVIVGREIGVLATISLVMLTTIAGAGPGASRISISSYASAGMDITKLPSHT